MTPAHCKLFLNAPQESMSKCEAKHGALGAEPVQTLADQLFGSARTGQEEDDE